MNPLPYSDLPLTVYLEIIYGCNLYCSYCYVGNERNHISPTLQPLELTKQILKKLREDGVTEIVLIGGEPTLHPRFSEICREISVLGFQSRGVITNGYSLSDSVIQTLQQCSFWVDISLRGADSVSFDFVAGKSGAFDKVMANAITLSGLGIAVGFEFDCIPSNYRRLYEIVKHLTTLNINIKQLQLHRIMPEGDAKEDISNFSLDLTQWQEVFAQALRLRQEFGIRVVFEDGFPYCLVPKEAWDMLTPCGCGYTQLTIDPKGDLRHCLCQSDSLGSILQNSLSKIWHFELEEYRANYRHVEACSQCDLFNACRGGCSASGVNHRQERVDEFYEFFHPIKMDVAPTSVRTIYRQELHHVHFVEGSLTS